MRGGWPADFGEKETAPQLLQRAKSATQPSHRRDHARSAAIREQSTVIQDIAGNIAQASSGVRDANMRVTQTAAVSGNIANEIAEVSYDTGQMVSASAQMQTSALQLSQLAAQLSQMVSQFKV